MDLDEIEGTRWWRVCVAAGWISHPCLFSFAISTDAKRIKAVSALSWNVAEHHVFLCSRAFRLFAVADEAAAAGSEEAEWGGDVGVGWERVWWISLFDVSAEMKKKAVREHLLSASLCVESALCCVHLISRNGVWDCTCIECVNPGKCAHWPICAFANKQPGLLLFFFLLL